MCYHFSKQNYMKNNLSNISIIFVILALFLVAACDQSASYTEKVELNPYMDYHVVSSAHNLKAGIIYIPLSEKDAPILAGNAIVKYADDDNILIESGRHLYRFNSKGEFCNVIGTVGQGPGEYIAPGRVSYDSKSDKLYLFTNGILQQWKLNGEYKGTIDIEDPSTVQSIVALKADTLLVLRRSYDKKGELSQRLQLINSQGLTIQDMDFSSDSTSVEIAMLAYPEIHKINDYAQIRNEWDGKIYSINSNGIDLLTEYDFGKYNSNRWIFQDASQRGVVGNQYVKLEECYLTSKYSFLSYWFDNMLHYVVIDFDGNVKHHTVNENEAEYAQGILVDDSKSLNFWPSYIDNSGNLYAVIDPGDTNNNELEYLSSKIDKQLTLESNPIIVRICFENQFEYR